MSLTSHARRIRFLTLAVLLFTLMGDPLSAQWITQASGTKARLRGLAVLNANVVWASGTQGTYTRTTDGGTTWKAGTVPDGTDLDFRDVHAVDDQNAFLLSIGEYRSAVAFVPGTNEPTLVAVGPTGADLSTDGGESWKPLEKTGFHAVGFSGPIDGGWGAGENGMIARFRGSLAARGQRGR